MRWIVAVQELGLYFLTLPVNLLFLSFPLLLISNLIDIQTVTFPIPRDASTKKQRFSVSVSDGVTTKVTRAVLLENDQSLRWNDTLGGL